MKRGEVLMAQLVDKFMAVPGQFLSVLSPQL
jgi:hypothetical protein